MGMTVTPVSPPSTKKAGLSCILILLYENRRKFMQLEREVSIILS